MPLNTYKSCGIHVHTSGTVSPIQAAIRTFQISPLKMNNKFQGFHPTCILSLDKLQWTEKSLLSRSIQMFILATVIANEQYTNHLSVNSRCCVTKQKTCKSYLWPLQLLQPSYPSCKYNNWNAATSKQSKQENTCQDYM